MVLAEVVRDLSLDADPARPRASRRTQLGWFVAGLVLFTVLPIVGIDVLELDSNLYAAVFTWVSLTFLASYVRATNRDVVLLFQRRWRSSLFFGLLASIYVVVAVLRAPATTGPSGLRLVADLLWRGVIYGIANSLVLTAFPIAVARGLFQGHVQGVVRRVAFAAVALVLIALLSAAHYLGFSQLRDRSLVRPEFAVATTSLPAALTMNPLGSALAQCAFQVTVTLHSYQSPVFVPPQIEVQPQYQPPGVFGPH